MPCKTWEILPQYWNPLCSMEFKPSVDNPSCNVCVIPESLTPPKGCFGCPADEIFPAVWKFKKDFAVPYTASGVITTSDSTTFPVLSRVPPGVTGPSTATVTRFMPDNVRSSPMTAVITTSLLAGELKHGCIWGNGAWKYSGWLWKPTFGSLAPPLGSCPMTTGFNEKRVEYAGGGPFINPNGTSIVGGGAGPAACYAPHGVFRYNNMPETVWPASALGYPYFGQDRSLYPGSFSNDCFPYSVNYTAYLRQQCVGWVLVSAGGNLVELSVSVRGYTQIKFAPIVNSSDSSGFYSAYFNNAPPDNSNWVIDRAGQALWALASVFPPTAGEIVWQGTYPCGNPASFSLTLVSRAGCLSGSSVPTTVTLMRG
jgi:hypothetical protein